MDTLEIIIDPVFSFEQSGAHSWGGDEEK